MNKKNSIMAFRKMIHLSALAITGTMLASCGNNSSGGSASTGDSSNTTPKKGITETSWGERDGKKVNLYTLTNKNGMQVTITNYGGTITSWITPDKNGKKSSIVLGFDKLEGYLAPPPYFGATIGRYGNRIAK